MRIFYWRPNHEDDDIEQLGTFRSSADAVRYIRDLDPPEGMTFQCTPYLDGEIVEGSMVLGVWR